MKHIIHIIIILYFFNSMLFGQNAESYNYDNLNRLICVVKSDSTTIFFQYDEVGNRNSKIVTVNKTNVLINKISFRSIMLYPNPTTESFCINGFEDFASLKLMDISGKIMLEKQIKNKEIITISSLPDGLYIIKLILTDAVVEKKLVKK